MSTVNDYLGYEAKYKFLGTKPEFECIISNDEVLLCKYHGSDSIIEIPSFVNGIYKNSTIFEKVRGTLKVTGGRNLTDISWMFNESNASYIELDLEAMHIDTMIGTFKNCKCLERVSFGNLNTCNVRSFENLFYNCIRLEDIDFGSNFDTTNVSYYNSMFNSCISLKRLTLDFNTKYAFSMKNMFSRCYNLQYLHLGENFILDRCSNMSGMFSNCEYLESIDLRFNDCQVYYINSMFFNCKKLKKLKLNFDLFESVECYSMFEGCESLEYLELFGDVDIDTTLDIDSMFIDCKSLKKIVCNNNLFLNGFKEVENIFDKDVSCEICCYKLSDDLKKVYTGLKFTSLP